MHENREASVLAAAGQSGPGRGKTSKLGVYDTEESESAVVCAEQLIAHEG